MNKLPDSINLSKDFPEISYEKWREQVEKDLKGQPFDKKLITKTYEGINLQPIYNREDIENLQFVNSKPGFNDFLRGANASGYIEKQWNVQQSIPYTEPEKFNEALKSELERGQNCIYIKPDIDENFSGLKFDTLDDVKKIFKEIDITKYPVIIDSGVCGLIKFSLLISYLKSENISFKLLKGSLDVDPIAYAIKRGTMDVSSDYAFQSMADVTKWALDNSPGFKTIGVSTIHYQNAGASAVQELAFALATGVEYINKMQDNGINANDSAKMIRFSFGISPFFFMEISKFRAARILWAKILEAYGVEENNRKMFINAETSLSNQTKLDPYVNMLRVTTEAFSALAAGVDSLRTSPFDESFRLTDEFSRRIARNTQIVLDEESHISDVIDPAGGSYFVEKLTSEVAVSAYKLFQTIQSKGGILKSLEEGFIQDSISILVDDRQKDYSKRKNILVGSNMYANIKEELLEERSENFENIKTKREKEIKNFLSKRDNKKVKECLEKFALSSQKFVVDETIKLLSSGATKDEVITSLKIENSKPFKIKPVKEYRASEIFEELRIASFGYREKNGNLPKIFLITMGGLKQHKPRADFSRGFLEVGGFDVIYEKGFDNVSDAVDSAIKHKVKAVVICSTDDTYPELVPEICSKLKSKAKDVFIILAGFPKEQIEAHKASGVNEFIYLGADVYAINKKIQNHIL